MSFWRFLSGVRKKKERPFSLERYVLEKQVADAFEAAVTRYCEWLDTHPVLRTVELEYRRGLILEVIRTYERALEIDMDIDKDNRFLEELYASLDDKPPPGKPPQSPKKNTSGFAFYMNSAIVRRRPRAFYFLYRL